MMGKYNVWLYGTYSKNAGVVEANSKEEAIEKAEEELDCYASLCHHCSSIDLGDAEFDADEQSE